MTLLEEKKMVATWMGWEYDKHADAYLRFNHPRLVCLEFWNPQSERKFWDEIWGQMDEDETQKYCFMLDRHLKDDGEPYSRVWGFLTAKPAICWQALIQTLGE